MAMDRSDLPAVDLGGFTPHELNLLAQRLTVVAETLQTEIAAVKPGCLPTYMTFAHLARLVRWRRYLAYLIRAVFLTLRQGERPTFYVSDLPLEPSGLAYFIDLLRSERYQAEMNAYSIRANVCHEPALRDLIERGQAQAIDIEARFYTCLLNSLATA